MEILTQKMNYTLKKAWVEGFIDELTEEKTLRPVAKPHTGRQIPCICSVTHLTYFPLSAFEMDH